MNKIAIFFLLFSFQMLFSQQYTEKWNSLYNRYETFDSSGNMISYKVYNSLYQRWETYTTQSTNSGYETGRTRIDENFEILRQTMQTKQNNYDRNYNRVKEVINSCSKYILGMSKMQKVTYETYVKANDNFILCVNKINNYDYSSNATTDSVVSYLLDCTDKIVCNYYNYCE